MPVSTTYPGVYVVEEVSSVHTIIGVPTSVAAFVGRAPRGPVNTAIRINSWPEYERTFGGLDPSSPMSDAVYLFFVNGGSAAQVVRGDAKEPNNAKSAIYQVGSVHLAASSPGDWANDLKFEKTLQDPTKPEGPYTLTVTDNISRRTETFSGISPDGPITLEIALRASSLVRPLTDAEKKDAPKIKDPPKEDKPNGPGEGNNAGKPDPKAAVPPPNPPVVAGVPTPEGTPIEIEAGWSALASVDIFNMLVLPTRPDGAGPVAQYAADILGAAAEFCKEHRAVLIVDPPAAWATADSNAIVNSLPPITGDVRDCSAVYYPNLVLTNRRTGVQRKVGPSGAIAGIWARTDSERGVWKAPAGTHAGITGITGLEVSLLDTDIGILNPVGVNCLKTIPFIGPVVWGARTIDGADSLASEWKYLPVRRMAKFIAESLQRGTLWAVFEPNDEPLWSSLRLNIGSFMNTLFRQGAFQGSTPADAYIVRCDEKNNPQEDIDRGIVNILVGFAPLKPAEFVIIHIEQMAGPLQT